MALVFACPDQRGPRACVDRTVPNIGFGVAAFEIHPACLFYLAAS